MNQLRIFFIGGAMSYRAMFGWMNPWIFIPVMLIEPICQILLFAYIGRSAGVGSDEFYVMGNALNYAAIPCLFAMSSTIAGERYSQTLGLVLISPARRIPLFLGRSAPVILNGWAVAMFGVLSGSFLLDTSVPGSAWPLIALVVGVGSISLTGLGLVLGAVALRVRDSATLANVLFLALLIFTGTNVALADLPDWMAAVGPWLPLTHAIEATRMLADHATWSAVTPLVGRELIIGAAYIVIGMTTLGWLERLSRSGATLERM